MTDQPTDLRDRIVAAMRRAPFEDLRADWNAPNGPLKITARIDDLADAVLAELPAVPVVPVSSPPPDQTAEPTGFVLWLEASDGSVSTHDGIRWPDGWATIRHRHYGHTTTHHSPEAACQATHGKQGRIVWPAPPPADRAAAPVSASPPADYTTDPSFVPPAAEGFWPAVFDSATDGASALDAWARTPHGRNFLAHALAQLARDGWLRTKPGEGFEPVHDRDDTPEPQDPAELRRLAAEAQQPDTETPCGPTPDACDAEAGEPCANHEREQAHAEGEHCFCGPECSETEPVHKGGNADDCPGPERP